MKITMVIVIVMIPILLLLGTLIISTKDTEVTFKVTVLYHGSAVCLLLVLMYFENKYEGTIARYASIIPFLVPVVSLLLLSAERSNE